MHIDNTHATSPPLSHTHSALHVSNSKENGFQRDIDQGSLISIFKPLQACITCGPQRAERDTGCGRDWPTARPRPCQRHGSHRVSTEVILLLCRSSGRNRGVEWHGPCCLSVCPSVRPSVCRQLVSDPVGLGRGGLRRSVSHSVLFPLADLLVLSVGECRILSSALFESVRVRPPGSSQPLRPKWKERSREYENEKERERRTARCCAATECEGQQCSH